VTPPPPTPTPTPLLRPTEKTLKHLDPLVFHSMVIRVLVSMPGEVGAAVREVAADREGAAVRVREAVVHTEVGRDSAGLSVSPCRRSRDMREKAILDFTYRAKALFPIIHR
jgi:hypothetical protein